MEADTGGRQKEGSCIKIRIYWYVSLPTVNLQQKMQHLSISEIAPYRSELKYFIESSNFPEVPVRWLTGSNPYFTDEEIRASSLSELQR